MSNYLIIRSLSLIFGPYDGCDIDLAWQGIHFTGPNEDFQFSVFGSTAAGEGTEWIVTTLDPPTAYTAGSPNWKWDWENPGWIPDETDMIRQVNDLAQALLAQAQVKYDERRQTPMSWDFGSIGATDELGIDIGDAGPQTLQMRDSVTPDGKRVDDIKNWLGVAAGASLAVISNQGDSPMRLKTTSNVWVKTTAADALTVLVLGDGPEKPSALQRGVLMLDHFGYLKQTIRSLKDDKDLSGLQAIDLNIGWPA